MTSRNRLLLALAIALTVGTAASSRAQDAAPATQAAEKQVADKQAVEKKSTLPASTNPTQRVIYPGEGQTEEQQMADQLECYRWASEQTGWDPYEAYDVLVAEGYAAAQTAQEAQGGLVGGAARGAVAGVIIGAIAGDAGKGAAIGAAAGGLGGGMRSRRQRAAAQSQAEQAVNEFNRQLETWDRNYTACMSGKDYTVN